MSTAVAPLIISVFRLPHEPTPGRDVLVGSVIVEFGFIGEISLGLRCSAAGSFYLTPPPLKDRVLHRLRMRPCHALTALTRRAVVAWRMLGDIEDQVSDTHPTPVSFGEDDALTAAESEAP